MSRSFIRIFRRTAKMTSARRATNTITVKTSKVIMNIHRKSTMSINRSLECNNRQFVHNSAGYHVHNDSSLFFVPISTNYYVLCLINCILLSVVVTDAHHRLRACHRRISALLCKIGWSIHLSFDPYIEPSLPPAHSNRTLSTPASVRFVRFTWARIQFPRQKQTSSSK